MGGRMKDSRKGSKYELISMLTVFAAATPLAIMIFLTIFR